MNSLTFVVFQTPLGWMVSGSPPTGPFLCKYHALDLAEGMTEVINRLGGKASVLIRAEDRPAGVWGASEPIVGGADVVRRDLHSRC